MDIQITIRREQPKTAREAAVGSLIWMGRAVILLSLVVVGFQVGRVRLVWVALAMLAVYPLYAGIYRRAITVRRAEVASLAAIAVALAILYVTRVQLW